MSLVSLPCQPVERPMTSVVRTLRAESILPVRMLVKLFEMRNVSVWFQFRFLVILYKVRAVGVTSEVRLSRRLSSSWCIVHRYCERVL